MPFSTSKFDQDNKKLHFFHSIKTELLLSFIVLGLLPLLLVVWLSFQSVSSELISMAERRLIHSTELQVRFIDNWFRHRISDINTQAKSLRNSQFLNALIKGFSKGGLPLADYVQSNLWHDLTKDKKKRQSLDRFITEYDYVDNVFLVDKLGNILFSIKPALELGKNISDDLLINSHFFKTVQLSLQESGVKFSDFEQLKWLSSEALGFFMAPMFNDNGEVLGLMVIKLRLNSFFKLFKTEPTAPVKFYLVSEKGFLRSPQDEPLDYFLNTLTHSALIQSLAKQPSELDLSQDQLGGKAIHYFNANMQPILGRITLLNIPNVSWYLISEYVEDRALRPIALFVNYFFAFVLILVLIIILVARKLANKITLPILKLVEGTNAVAEGNLDYQISLTTKNELGHLAENFNRMVLKRRLFEHKINSALAQNQLTMVELENQKYALDQHSIVAVTDLNGSIIYVNNKFCVISGYSKEELIGCNHRKLKSGLHDMAFYRKIYTKITQGKVWQGVICNRAKNGELYWVDTTIVPLRDKNSQLRRYIAIRTDITRQIKAQQKLKLAKEQYALALSVANDAIWDRDLVSDKVDFDKRFYNLTGYQLDDFPSLFKEWTKLIHPQDIEKTNLQLMLYQQGKVPLFKVEFRFLKKAGGYMWALAKGKFVAFDQNNQPTRMLGTFSDITEAKNAEQRWQFALEGSRDGVWDWNLENDSIYYSIRWKELLGYQADEIKDSTQLCRKMVHPADINKADEDINLHLNGETQYYENEHRVLCKDGSYKWVLDRGKVVLRDATGQALRMIGTYQDISQRKNAEQVLRNAQKMEAIGQLTGGIAHDFNNILGVIIGNVDLLLANGIHDEKTLNRLNSVAKSADRAANITKQLLAFSRIKEIDVQRANINDEINNLSEILKHTVGHNIQINYALAENLWSAEIAIGDFHDAVLNLIINARDAMPDGGEILMTTINSQLDAAFCSLHPGAKIGDYVLLKISDRGFGIAKESIDKIFEPFFTTKDLGKGTGLGLSMVFAFVTRSNGFIKAYSEVNKGSIFNLYLPRVVEQATQSVVQPRLELAQTSAKPYGDETILIVDDEIGLVYLSLQTLTELGYKTYHASSGEQALDILATGTKVDLVFSDIIMPGGIDGFQLANQITLFFPKIKLLLTSGFSQIEKDESRVQKDQFELLHKPYNQLEMAQKIRTILDRPQVNYPLSDFYLNTHNEKFIWSKKYLVGIESIDNDHHDLFNLLQQCKQLANKKAIKSLQKAVKKLIDFSEYHFKKEEVLMLACNFKQTKNHLQLHQLLLKQLKEKESLWIASKLTIESFIGFTEGWLKFHILGGDSELGSNLKGKEELITLTLIKLDDELASGRKT